MADQTQKPELFELNNGTMQVLISNLGCTITSLSVPGKDGNRHFVFAFFRSVFLGVFFRKIADSWTLCNFEGKLADVVLGFDSLDPYLVRFFAFSGDQFEFDRSLSAIQMVLDISELTEL